MSTAEISHNQMKAAAVTEALAERRRRRAENSTKREKEAEALKNEGNELFKNGDYRGAARIYTQAIESYGTKPVLMSNLAAAFMKLELYEETEWAADIALQYDPQMIKARFRRAMARKAMNNLKAARIDLETIIKNDPTCSLAIQELKNLPDFDGHTSEHDGDSDTALENDWPHYHDEPAECDFDSDTSDCLYVGNGTACRFYNHGGCAKGDHCSFSHAPDNNSVRDELGKNVCLYFLLGQCMFGAAKCIYSHTSDHLPSPGWWDNAAQVESAVLLLGLLEAHDHDTRAYNTAVRRFPQMRTLVPKLAQSAAKERLKAANELASKAQPRSKPTTSKSDPNQFVLLLSLENEGYFESMYDHQLKALRAKYTVTQALSLDDAIAQLSSPNLVGVFVTDVGIVRKRNGYALKKLVEYVKSGGSAVIGGMFSSHITGTEFASFFRKAWGLPWKFGSYHRTTFSLNPSHELAKRNPSLVSSYSMKAAHVGGVSPETAVYRPTSESYTQSSVFGPEKVDDLSEVPAATARVGSGYLSYLGDVNAEDESTTTILAMLGILDAPHPTPAPAPQSQVNKATTQDGSDTPSRGMEHPKGNLASSALASENMKSSLTQASTSGGDVKEKPFILIITLEDPDLFARVHSHQISALRKEAGVKTATTQLQAETLLASTGLAGVYLADAGIKKPAHSALLKRLVDYTKTGGTVVAAGLLPSMSTGTDMTKLFSAFGLGWRMNSYKRRAHNLIPTSELGKKNPSLPDSYSMKAVSVSEIDSEVLTYMEEDDSEPESATFESAVVRAHVEKGIFGFIGDVNAELETTSVLLAFFGLLDPPPGPPKPTSRKFAMILSLGSEDMIEEVYKEFFQKLRGKAEVVHKLSNERMIELMPSPDLVGILVTNSKIADPSHTYLVSKLVEYSKGGGTVVFCAMFAPQITAGEVRPFFFDGWGLNWNLAAGSENGDVKVNPTSDLVKRCASLPRTFTPGGYGLEGIQPEMAVYMPKGKMLRRWNPRTNTYISSIVYAQVEKGHVGFIGYANLTQEYEAVVLAMLGLEA